MKENPVLRVGLFASGMLCLNTAFSSWLNGRLIEATFPLLLNLLWSFFGLVSIILATVSHPPKRASWLVLLSLMGSFLIQSYLFDIRSDPASFSRTDSEMITELAVESMHLGKNPYATDFSGFLSAYRDRGLFVTPLADGTFEHRASYPALSYELFWLASLSGLDVRQVVKFFYLGILLLIFLSTPESLRAFILLPLIAINAFVGFSLIGIHDIIWSFFLVAMVRLWKRPLFRAIFFGLACSFRQQPWFLSLPLMIIIWHEEACRSSWYERIRPVFFFASMSFLVFLTTNTPFIVWDINTWFFGVFEHSYSSFNWFSSGPSLIVEYGIVNLPRRFFSITQGAIYFVALVFTWRHPRSARKVFWLIPLAYFYFYYRSLTHYWIYWIPPLLVDLARRQENDLDPLPKTKSTKRTIAVAVASIVAILVIGMILLRPKDLVTVTVIRTHKTSNGFISKIDLILRNRSHLSLQPHFAVRQLYAIQPLPWRRRKGPQRVERGEEALYSIAPPPNQPQRFVDPKRGAQIVVTDSTGADVLRSTTFIRAQSTIPAWHIRRQERSSRLGSEYFVQRGLMYQRDRNYRLAAKAFRRALATKSHDPRAAIGRAEALFWLGHWRKAWASYEIALSRNYRRADAAKGIAWCAYNLKEYDEAKRFFWLALEFYSENKSGKALVHRADCLKGLASIYAQLGDCRRARSLVVRATKWDPTIQPAPCTPEHPSKRENARPNPASIPSSNSHDRRGQ